MRVVIQRVRQASVEIDYKIEGKIDKGLLILIGIEDEDNQEDIEWLCKKIVKLRIFPDEKKPMNISIKDVNGSILVVSQFTLHASTKKGNRPSFIKAGKPVVSRPLYEAFLTELEKQLGKPVKRGQFGADMKVSLINDGPVTILIDSKNKE